jgi:nicotinamide-nucleotide amidase
LVAEIIAVGTELLLGQIVDTNSAYISRRLAEIGVEVYFKSCVGDNQRRFESVLRLALSRSDLVIVTGGLGPTDDDITASSVASVLGRQLVYSEDAASDVERYFARMGRKPAANNLKQAMVMADSTVIRNEVGTAPGQIVRAADKTVVLLPGVPLEMEWMMETAVIPYLKAMRLAGDQTISSRVLRVAGIGESSLVAEIADVLDCQTNPTIAPLAADGLVDLRITAKAASEALAQEMIDAVATSIRDRLGVLVYGENGEGLAEVVGGLLAARGLTVALAESCTGGLLGKMMTDAPGSSRYFVGGVVTYSNESKERLLCVPDRVLREHGAVSRQTAVAMSLGVKELMGSSVSVSVTGVAGPGGGSAQKPVGLVYVAVAGLSSLSVARFMFNGNREQVRRRTAVGALNLLRRVLLAEATA